MSENSQEKELPTMNELAIEDDNKSDVTTQTLDEFQRSCSCCLSEATGGGSCCSLIVDKLFAKLKIAEEERANLLKENQILTERAEKAEKDLEMSKDKQMRQFLLDFPSTKCYLIMAADQYLYAKSASYDRTICELKLGKDSATQMGKFFKISKNSDGTFAITSGGVEKLACKDSNAIELVGADCNEADTKFDLTLMPEPVITKEGKFALKALMRVLNKVGFVGMNSGQLYTGYDIQNAVEFMIIQP